MSLALRDKDFCLQKLDAAIALVESLTDNEFPHPDSRLALEPIARVYKADKELLLSLEEDAEDDTILGHCLRANVNIVRLKNFLGLILRSSHLRNAFEIYFPIKVLSRELLGTPTAVVLSSEWHFSPYTYPVALQELPEFIFIGIPASECQNPLITPLAGHELGHVVWSRKGVRRAFEPRIQDCIVTLYRDNWDAFKRSTNGVTTPDRLETDMFLRNIWTRSYKIARRQLEELFCDFLGVHIFGMSYLHSFRYLLAPSLGPVRQPLYPRIGDRARYIRYAAIECGLKPEDDYMESFNEDEPDYSKSDEFVIQRADNATENLYKALPNLVRAHSGGVRCVIPDDHEERRARESLRNLVPAVTARSITPIVNAAWAIRLEIDDWGILKSEADEAKRRQSKMRVLRDLVLKSFEVYEYNFRLAKRCP